MTAPTIPDNVAHYDIRRGDSLWKISVHELGSGLLASDLAKLNGLSLNARLAIGQRLIVPNYQRCDLTTTYMLSEMLKNAQSTEVKAIADAIKRSKSFHTASDKAFEEIQKASWYEIFKISGSQATFETMIQMSGIAMAEAQGRWFVQVLDGGPWDHKPILTKKYKEMGTPPRPFGSMNRAFHFPIRGDLFNEYYYDVWSNIHYGYIGTLCGFDETTLQAGAASGLPGAGDNDEGDVISVKIGIALWKKYGLKIDATILQKAITAQAATYLAARNMEIKKGIKAEKATNVVITNNDYK